MAAGRNGQRGQCVLSHVEVDNQKEHAPVRTLLHSMVELHVQAREKNQNVVTQILVQVGKIQEKICMNFLRHESF